MQNATQDLSRDEILSSIHLIGGVDCDATFVRKPCDLRIEGGATIKKSLLLLGNIHINDIDKFLFGNTCGSIFTSFIQEKEPGQGITIVGNINVDEIGVTDVTADMFTANIVDAEFVQAEIIDANIVCTSNVQVDIIENKIGDMVLDVTNATVGNSAGAVIEYLQIIVNGSPRKIPLHLIS